MKKEKPDLVIMAGGEGQRLRPLTYIIPKPLLCIEPGVSALERIIENFRKYGVDKVWVIVKYQADLIRSYIKIKNIDNIEIVEEPEMMGTVGGVSLIGNSLSENFYISNCDILVDFDIEKLYRKHVSEEKSFSIVAFEKKVKMPYGVFEFDGEGVLKDFLEKPSICLLANSGVYLLNKSILKYIEEGQKMDMDELFYKILSLDYMKINIHSISEKDFMDIGEFEQYKKVLEVLC